MNDKNHSEDAHKKGVKHQEKNNKKKNIRLQRFHSFTDVPFRKLFKSLSNLSSHSNSASTDNLLKKLNSHDLIPDSYFNRPLINSEVSSSVAYRSVNGPLRLIKSNTADTTKKKYLPNVVKSPPGGYKTQVVTPSRTSIGDNIITSKPNPVKSILGEEKNTRNSSIRALPDNSVKPTGKFENKLDQLNIGENNTSVCLQKESPVNKNELSKHSRERQKTKITEGTAIVSEDESHSNVQTTKHCLINRSVPLDSVVVAAVCKPKPAKSVIAEENSSSKPSIRVLHDSSIQTTEKLEKKRDRSHKGENHTVICLKKENPLNKRELSKHSTERQKTIITNNTAGVSEDNFKLADINIQNTKHYKSKISAPLDSVVVNTVCRSLDSERTEIDPKTFPLSKLPPIPPQHKLSKSLVIKNEDKSKITDANKNHICITNPVDSLKSSSNVCWSGDSQLSSNIQSSQNYLHNLQYNSTRKQPKAQQYIRDEQEKTIIQLHQKHLKEIYDLRSKQSSLDSNAERRINDVPHTIPVQVLSKNNSSDIAASIPKTNDLKKKKGILKKPSAGSKSGSPSKDEASFSFSGYLKRSRSKDSISSKDENSNPTLNEATGNLKDKLSINDNINHERPNLQNIDNKIRDVDVPPHQSCDIKIRKVEFSEPLDKVIPSNSDAQFDCHSKAKQSVTKPKDNTKLLPKKPPRYEKKLQKKTSTSSESDDMKHHRHQSSIKDNNISGNKQTNENTHPPLQKVARGRQYKPPELPDDPFGTFLPTNNRSFPEPKNDPVKTPSEQYKDKPPDSVTSPPVPPTRVTKDRDDSLTRNSTNESRKKGASARAKMITPGILITACANGEEDEITKLLKDITRTSIIQPAALNELDIAGRTSLSHCCSNGFRRAVEILTAHANIDMNLSDSEGNGPLHYAAQGGHIEVVSHLVNTCSRHVDLDARNIHGFTPLMKAAIQGRTKISKILLFAGASPHLRDFGRGLNAVEWARYTGRGGCSDLIDSVQRSCSSYIRDRWTGEGDTRPHTGTSVSPQQYYHLGPDKNSWLKHKIKKAFHKSDSKKEFSVASNLSTLATCVSSPLVSVPTPSSDGPAPLPKVKVTEVSAPDCYNDPEEPQSCTSESFSVDYTSSSSSTTPE